MLPGLAKLSRVAVYEPAFCRRTSGHGGRDGPAILWGHVDREQWQVLASQALLLLGAIANEVTAALEAGTFEWNRLPALLMVATMAYMQKRRGDITLRAAEEQANKAFVRGLSIAKGQPDETDRVTG